MVPTPSPVLVHSPNQPGRHPHPHPHRHPRRRPAPPRTELFQARAPDSTLQPSMVFASIPFPVAPTPSESVALVPEPSTVPTSNNPPQQPSQFIDVPGNIAAAVVVIVVILGGLIGLMVGGESLRRQVRNAEKRAAPPPPGGFGPQKSEFAKRASNSQYPRTPSRHEKFSYDEKTLTPLMRPPPVLKRERQRRLSDVWPIRGLSRAMHYRRSCPVQVGQCPQHVLLPPPPLATGPQTTWSTFTPVSPYVPPARTVLAAIPEEHEDAETDFAVMLGVALRQSVESSPAVPPDSKRHLPRGSSAAVEGCDMHGFEIMRREEARDEDTKSLESSAPGMTSDGGESSRSSMASLKSLDNDRESIREEVFELKRAQTRSMQMNKGVLLSLSLKTLDASTGREGAERARDPSRPYSMGEVGEGGRDYDVGREMGLVMLGGDFSAVNLDEFPSPPSILPMIPSFVSGF